MENIKDLILIERYLNGELNSQEISEFELRLENDLDFLEIFENHVLFLDELHQFKNRQIFLNKLNNTAQQHSEKILLEKENVLSQKTPKNTSEYRKIILSLLNKNAREDNSINWGKIIKFNLISTAAVAIIAVFSTLWITGYFSAITTNTSNYRELRRDVNAVKRNINAHDMALKSINEQNHGISTNNFGATGFLISTSGHLITNYHVIKGADSIQLQNSKGETFSAEIVFSNEEKDLAILKIADSTFIRPKSLPYTFKEGIAALGEDVFTLGYPRDEPVYGQGYLSSMSGYNGDTLAYQISIPVNPGNSGGPLLDSKGNIIGIVSGKQNGLDGTSFAIKTRFMLELINQIPAEQNDEQIVLNKRNSLNGLQRTEQLNRLKDHVYLVKVY